jgi:hypothetical protein
MSQGHLSGNPTYRDLALPLPDPITGGKRISRQESTTFRCRSLARLWPRSEPSVD